MQGAVLWREGPAGFQMQARLLHEKTWEGALLALPPPLWAARKRCTSGGAIRYSEQKLVEL